MNFVCQTFDGDFMAGPGCPAFVLLEPLRRSMAPFPCRPEPDVALSRKVGLISSARCSDGWMEGWVAVTGTHETYWPSRMPRSHALPPGWPTGEVLIRFLTDEPSGNRPSLEWREAVARAARIIDSDRWLRLRVRTRPTPATPASCTGPHKWNGPGLELSATYSLAREVGPLPRD